MITSLIVTELVHHIKQDERMNLDRACKDCIYTNVSSRRPLAVLSHVLSISNSVMALYNVVVSPAII